MNILTVVILLFTGEIEYRKFLYNNKYKLDDKYIYHCEQFAEEIRKKISYHTWNYKNQGPKSQGWYLKNESGLIIATIC